MSAQAVRALLPSRVALRTDAEALVGWAALLAGVVAFALRAVHTGTSYDLHIDELLYYRLAQSAADDLHLRIFGESFFLHPPAFFYLEALYLKIIQPSGDLIHRVYVARYLNVALGGVSGALVFLLAYRLGGWVTGIVGATLFALDPFVIRFNSLDLLETLAITCVLAGYAIILPAVDEPGDRLPTGRIVAAGLVFGLGLLSKDMTGGISVFPLLICFLFRWGISRVSSGLIALIALAVYLPYPIFVAAIGEWHTFEQQKFRGISRFLGKVQETGFHQKGGPSLVQTILADLDIYITTYTLIAAGMVAIVVLFFTRNPRYRIAAIWAVGAYAMLAYGVGHGTLEEQFFYFLVAPVIPVVAAAGVVVFRTGWILRPVLPLVRGVLALVACAFLLWSSYLWFVVHTVPDNGYQRLYDYVTQNIPAGTEVAMTTWTADTLLGFYVKDPPGSVEYLHIDHAQYLQVNTQQIFRHYGLVTTADYAWLQRHAVLVFAYTDRSFGTVALYRLPPHPRLTHARFIP